ncbi:hypothetical protein HY489_02850 [Candidatus Woesearchaeota archaeon]|nr:hypothetical protein [Candidatus Woesearchaeota archaeon]
MKKTIITALVVAISALSAAAQTGDWGMMGGSMYYSPWKGFLTGAFFLGLTLVVWLWAYKLWKEIRRMK